MSGQKRKKIAFFTPTLHGGGAERMMIDISNEFSKKNYDVDLLFLTSEGADLLSLIRPDVNLVNLSCKKMQFSIFKLSSYLRDSNPEAIISTQFHSNLALAVSSTLSHYKGKVIYRLCNMMTTYWRGNSKLRNFKGWLVIKLFMTLTLKRADFIIAQTTAMKEEVINDYHAKPEKVKTIPNFIDQAKIDKLAIKNVTHEWLSEKNDNIPVILSAGRLDLQKDWDTLLKAFNKLQKKIKARLIIIGDGPDRKKLERYIKENKLFSCVSLAGFQLNPFAWMAKSDLFVLSTFGEGFPNVVIQSLACDCPVVSTDVPSAPREILEDGKWGRLSRLKDPDSLYENIRKSLEEEKIPNLKAGVRFYDKNKVITKWFQLIEEN